jgi:hypothetical protein
MTSQSRSYEDEVTDMATMTDEEWEAHDERVPADLPLPAPPMSAWFGAPDAGEATVSWDDTNERYAGERIPADWDQPSADCECNGGAPCDCPDCDHTDCSFQQPEDADVRWDDEPSACQF